MKNKWARFLVTTQLIAGFAQYSAMTRVGQEDAKEVTKVERFHGRSGREFMIIRRNGMYECPSCHNLYKWKKSMLSHLRNQCRQPPRFQCPHCTMKNYQKAHMTRHLRVHHPQMTQMFWDCKLNGFFRL